MPTIILFGWYFAPWIQIHLTLMRIRILDPHWKKMDPDPNPDPGHFFKIYWLFSFIFFAYFYPKTWWTIPKWGNLYNLSFSKNSDLGYRKKFLFCNFWLIFYSLDPDPHIFTDPDLALKYKKCRKIPNFLAVFMTLQAISPLLAMRSFSIGRTLLICLKTFI